MAIVNATSTLKIVRVVITRHHVTSIMTIIMFGGVADAVAVVLVFRFPRLPRLLIVIVVLVLVLTLLVLVVSRQISS